MEHEVSPEQRQGMNPHAFSRCFPNEVILLACSMQRKRSQAQVLHDTAWSIMTYMKRTEVDHMQTNRDLALPGQRASS